MALLFYSCPFCPALTKILAGELVAAHTKEVRSGRRQLPCGIMHDDNVTPKCDHIGSCNVPFVSSGRRSFGGLTRTVSEQCVDLQLLSPSSLC